MLIAALTQYSRNNVWRELVLDKGDAVAQQQFALFQALHLDEVRSRRLLQRHNRGIEVAMLLLQARQFCPKLAFFLLRHRCPGRAEPTERGSSAEKPPGLAPDCT